MIGKIEYTNIITTKDMDGVVNGSVIELFKEGRKTEVYIVEILPNMSKGYHEHTIITSRYACIKGTVEIELVHENEVEIHVLFENCRKNIKVPTGVKIKLTNIGDEVAWLVGFPDPPFDPLIWEVEQINTR